MVLCSFRISQRWRSSALLLLLLAAVIGTGRLVTAALDGSDAPASASIKRQAGKTEEQRQKFLAALGWTVEAEPSEVTEVVIPKEFDEVYDGYEEIQSQQGMSLKKYRGKRCTRYTYVVTNYPDEAARDVRVNLLVCGGKIVGGDVCSLGLDGFMHGLAFPDGVTKTTLIHQTNI